MRSHWHSIWLIFLVVLAPTRAEASIPVFVDELFAEIQSEIASSNAPQYDQFCARYDLDPSAPSNQQHYLRVTFLHDLLTTSSASNGARGGYLKTPYFWHWVEPNPRHAIVSLPDSIPLKSIKPPAPFQRYASFADIDRVPALYWKDLMSEAPGYNHPQYGTFCSFGWCSEREMAFTALMTAWGYSSKVYQAGIHTTSMVWCEFKGTNGEPVVLVANVDNTFDSIVWQRVPNHSQLPQWMQEVGDGAQIGWYNKKARSADQIEQLERMTVTGGAQDRIRAMVRRGLSAEQGER